MANKRNKVKFGLSNVHWAKITQWGADADGTPTVPVYGESMRLPGAVSLSIDANGENENFYADDSVYYVINNNSGYEGDLEVRLSPPNLPPKFWEKFSITTVCLWRRTPQNRRSLH